MMRGPHKQSIAVRRPDGGIELKTEDLRLVKDRYPVLGLPLIRGVVNFFSSLAAGVKALMYSASFYPEEEGEPSAFDKWLEKHIPSEKLDSLIITLAVVLGAGLAVALFMILPTLLAGLIQPLHERILLRNLTEGVIKVIIFTLYMYGISRMKDMRRVFSYHGAEHKTIKCYEKGLPLTVENVRPCTRFHPRCGTSFLFVVVILSILIGSVVQTSNTGLRILAHLGLLFPVVAVAYELNRIVGRHDNRLTRILTAPGMGFQHFTTNEPDDSMIECAIAALKEVIPENEGDDDW